MPADDDRAKHAMALLDGQCNKWAEEVDLTSMIKNAVSPMRLNRNAPKSVREQFTARMERQIDAIARQAFVEGMYRGITGLSDERKMMREFGIDPDQYQPQPSQQWQPKSRLT